MKTSNGFPGAGSTITLGPLGRVAHPAKASNVSNAGTLYVTSDMCHSSVSGGAGVGTTCFHPFGHVFTYG